MLLEFVDEQDALYTAVLGESTGLQGPTVKIENPSEVEPVAVR